MTAPARIQLRRAKGWRMPENTIVVSRPSKWGNPFDWQDWLEDAREFKLELPTAENREEWAKGQAVESFIAAIRDGGDDVVEFHRTNISDLRGKNLACWCAPGQPCHADVLLDMANRPTCEEVASP